MEFSRDDLKAMVGKRVTIDGERHRVAKVSVKEKTLTMEKGVTIDCEGIYKRGPGFFFDSPKKSGKKTVKVEKDAKPPKQEKVVTKPAAKDKPARQPRVKRDEPEAPKEKVRKKSAAKKFAFDQGDTEKLVAAISAAVRELLPELEPSLQLGIHGGVYNTDVAVVTLGFAPAGMSKKEVRALFADRAELCEVMHADEAEEEDDMSDLDEDEEEEDEEMDDSFEEDDEEEEDEDDEEEEDEEDEEAAQAAADAMTKKLLKKLLKTSPNSNPDRAETYIRDYLLSSEVEDALGDELVPGVTMITEKDGKSYLLAGFDIETDKVRVINVANGKFRSLALKDVVRLEYA